MRLCHWTIAASILVLGVSGFVILMAHPRLYWGQVGNDLMPAFLELPLNDNHRPAGWQPEATFAELPNAPVSASQAYGVAIGPGNVKNRVVGVSGSGNGTYDAADYNPGCGNDIWTGNQFGYSYPSGSGSCVH